MMDLVLVRNARPPEVLVDVVVSVLCLGEGISGCRGTSLKRNSPPPWDHHMTLGTVLL